MPVLNVEVKNKRITGNNLSVVCDNTDYVVNFTFDAEWEPFETKTLRVSFVNGDYYDISFQGNTVALPMIVNVRTMFLGVYAGELHSSTPLPINTKPSILDGSTGEQVIPVNDLYQELLEESWG